MGPGRTLRRTMVAGVVIGGKAEGGRRPLRCLRLFTAAADWMEDSSLRSLSPMPMESGRVAVYLQSNGGRGDWGRME